MPLLLSLILVVIGILLYALKTDKGPRTKYARKNSNSSAETNTETSKQKSEPSQQSQIPCWFTQKNI